MSFAKIPSQPPQFDAGAFGTHAGLTPADVKNFQSWKRWLNAELEFDGADKGGLRDVVAANAQGLNAVKADNDRQDGQITTLFEEVTALKARPPVPFPVSGQLKAGGT